MLLKLFLVCEYNSYLEQADILQSLREFIISLLSKTLFVLTFLDQVIRVHSHIINSQLYVTHICLSLNLPLDKPYQHIALWAGNLKYSSNGSLAHLASVLWCSNTRSRYSILECN